MVEPELCDLPLSGVNEGGQPMPEANSADPSQSDPSQSEPSEPDASPDDDALLAGADVERPSDAEPVGPHTTRTLADVERQRVDVSFPLTTDDQAQQDGSVVNPETS